MSNPDKLHILHNMARELNSSVHLEQVLQRTLVQVAELLGLETGWVFLLDTEEIPYLAAALNLPPGLDPASKPMQGSCYCLDLFRTNRLDTARNIQMITCSRLNGLKAGTDGLRFHASIPLQASDKKLGVLNVASRHKPALNQAELNTLYTLGDLLSLAIERTRFYEENLNLSTLAERYRLARELHDSLGQGLTALVLQLEILDALVDKGASPEKLKTQIAQGQKLARRNLQEARRSVQDLRSDPQALPPLKTAVKQLLQELLPQINISLEWDDIPCSPALEHSLYRMTQELLTNVHKHAQASKVKLYLKLRDEELSLKIQDNGVGFDPENIPTGHFGLLGLRERVHLLQGRMQLCSEPGQGTQITLTLPHQTTEVSHDTSLDC